MNKYPVHLAVLLPVLMVSSCASLKGDGGRPHPLVACTDVNQQVYSGLLNNGYTVTINFRDMSDPGFKHNVEMDGPPPLNLPAAPQRPPLYDAECVDGAPTTFKIYVPYTDPPKSTRVAVWSVSPVTPAGYAFHLTDPGSTLFPAGAQGDFKQLQ